MDAKEYLSQVKLLTAKLKITEAYIEVIRGERLTLRSAWPDGQPHGTITGDPTSQKAIELLEKLREYEKKAMTLRSNIWSKRMQIIETVNKVRDAECMELLYYKYINLLTWEETAAQMHYSTSHVSGPLHNKALGLIEELIKDNKK